MNNFLWGFCFACIGFAYIMLGLSVISLGKRLNSVEQHATKCYKECLEILRFINNVKKENENGAENVES